MGLEAAPGLALAILTSEEVELLSVEVGGVRPRQRGRQQRLVHVVAVVHRRAARGGQPRPEAAVAVSREVRGRVARLAAGVRAVEAELLLHRLLLDTGGLAGGEAGRLSAAAAPELAAVSAAGRRGHGRGGAASCGRCVPGPAAAAAAELVQVAARFRVTVGRFFVRNWNRKPL